MPCCTKTLCTLLLLDCSCLSIHAVHILLLNRALLLLVAWLLLLAAGQAVLLLAATPSNLL